MNIVGSTTNSYNLGSIENPVRVCPTNNRFAVLSEPQAAASWIKTATIHLRSRGQFYQFLLADRFVAKHAN